MQAIDIQSDVIGEIGDHVIYLGSPVSICSFVIVNLEPIKWAQDSLLNITQVICRFDYPFVLKVRG